MKAAIPFAWAGLVFVFLFGSLRAEDWAGFRGPRGSAVSEDKNLPVEINKDTLQWKIKLPGLGTASPIVHGDKVFVASYSGYGTTLNKGKGKGGFGKGGFGKGGLGDADEQKDLKFHLTCYDRKKGEVLWQKDIEPKLPDADFSGFLRDHGYASSTPVTDGERVYAFFGKTGVMAFDMEGKTLWQKSVGTSVHMWGSAASPILYKDLLIVNAAIESKSVVAFDKKTGEEKWRIKGVGTSWSSPILVETKGGKQELVLNEFGKIAGHDPESGKELWTCKGIGGGGKGGKGGKDKGKGGFGGGFGFGGYTCTSPVAQNGVVFITGGGGPNGPPTAMAIKTGGKGDVSETHILWKEEKAGTGIASPVVHGDYLYFVAGNAYCLRADNGKVVYNKRLYDGFNEYTSAVAAGDKIYALTRFDGLFVLAAGENFKELAHNEFDGDDSIFNASPAISNGRIYIRSNRYLYCIGNKE